MADETLLTTAQLAARWGRSAGAIRQDRMRGRGPAFTKLGPGDRAPVRYRLSDIEAYERRVQPQDGAR